MNSLTLEFDPWRGGFCISSQHIKTFRKRHVIFNHSMVAWLNENNKIISIESAFGDRGGMPLAGFYKSNKHTEGTFFLNAGENILPHLYIFQNKEIIKFCWGQSNFQEDNDIRKDDLTHIKISFSQEKTEVLAKFLLHSVTSLEVEFSQTIWKYPIECITIFADDFK